MLSIRWTKKNLTKYIQIVMPILIIKTNSQFQSTTRYLTTRSCIFYSFISFTTHSFQRVLLSW
jgi:hypothetical protein